MKKRKQMQWLWILSICLLTCVGCTRLNRAPTAEEQAMVKETLEETSPRYENNQPKAIPEFKFTFGGPKKRKVKLPAADDEVSDRDILLDNS